MKSYFKSEEGKQAVLALYDQKLESLNLDYESRMIQTTFGETHMLISGNPGNPPLIVVHGSNGCAPISLETYPNLVDKYQVFAVDVLAQPNKSEGRRLSMKDDSYGQWMNEIIRILDLENVTMAGFSFGGLIILKTLINNEEKIKEVFLAAPAYIVNGNPLRLLFNIFIPMKRYMKTANQQYILRFLHLLFSEDDEFALQYLSKVFLHFEMDFTPVPVIKKTEARSISTPITLFAAKDDLMFPGVKMIKRAKQIFPSLKNITLLQDSKHVQNRRDNLRIEAAIMKK